MRQRQDARPERHLLELLQHKEGRRTANSTLASKKYLRPRHRHRVRPGEPCYTNPNTNMGSGGQAFAFCVSLCPDGNATETLMTTCCNLRASQWGHTFV